MVKHRAAPNKAIKLAGVALFFCVFTLAYLIAALPAIAASPTVGTVSPSSGSIAPDTAKAFTSKYSDRDGWKNIKETYLLICGNSANLENTAYLYYDQNTNLFYVRNDFNTAWLGGFAPRSANTIENSYVILNCASSTASGSASTLTVKWNLTFKTAYSGKTYNTYLKVTDDTGLYTAWVKKGTWTVRPPTLSLSINPKLWDIGQTEVNKTITMDSQNKITVTNNGLVKETFSLSLINPAGWIAASIPGKEIYVLSGLFCGLNDTPTENDFNKDKGNEDALTIQSKKTTKTIFGYSQATANGVSVPRGNNNKRSLFLQFKSPTLTDKTQQEISVIVSAETP